MEDDSRAIFLEANEMKGGGVLAKVKYDNGHVQYGFFYNVEDMRADADRRFPQLMEAQ